MEFAEKTKKLIKARNAAEKAEKEIRKLQRELRNGTLDRKKLDSGLQQVDEYVKIMQRVPPHN
jgi:hypothetical protein